MLALVVIFFHILDRQIEFTSRTDYLWKAKLKVEQEEVETMRGINKVILLTKTSSINYLITVPDIVRKYLARSRRRTFLDDTS